MNHEQLAARIANRADKIIAECRQMCIDFEARMALFPNEHYDLEPVRVMAMMAERIAEKVRAGQRVPEDEINRFMAAATEGL